MPKVFVRTQPKSGLKTRHRCAMGFTDVWKEIDVDDATRKALEEDPYLEVSDTPTVMVEVAATVEQPVKQAAEQTVEEAVEQPVETTSKKSKKAAE